MNEHLPPIRRVVTGDDVKGNSRIVEDAAATAIRNVPARPGYRAVNIWRTEEAPCRIGAPDSISKHEGILPPRNGTILRIIHFPPEPKVEGELKHIGARGSIRACIAPRRWTMRSSEPLGEDGAHRLRADRRPAIASVIATGAAQDFA